MRAYNWAIDGLGRQFISCGDASNVVMCCMPGAANECAMELENQDKEKSLIPPKQKIFHVAGFGIGNCEWKVGTAAEALDKYARVLGYENYRHLKSKMLDDAEATEIDTQGLILAVEKHTGHPVLLDQSRGYGPELTVNNVRYETYRALAESIGRNSWDDFTNG